MFSCSTANIVPVRPKPVATSSQMSNTSLRRQAASSRAGSRGAADHAGRALHHRLRRSARQSREPRASSSASASDAQAMPQVGVSFFRGQRCNREQGPEAPGRAAGGKSRGRAPCRPRRPSPACRRGRPRPAPRSASSPACPSASRTERPSSRRSPPRWSRSRSRRRGSVPAGARSIRALASWIEGIDRQAEQGRVGHAVELGADRLDRCRARGGRGR